MATARKSTAKAKAADEEPQDAEQAPEEQADQVAGEIHARGGWDVGYVGDRVDDADDDAYTVAGVLKAARDSDE